MFHVHLSPLNLPDGLLTIQDTYDIAEFERWLRLQKYTDYQKDRILHNYRAEEKLPHSFANGFGAAAWIIVILPQAGQDPRTIVVHELYHVIERVGEGKDEDARADMISAYHRVFQKAYDEYNRSTGKT